MLAMAFFAGVSASQAFASTETVSKDDACQMPDGLHRMGVAISNYPGYSIQVGSFYKEKNVLIYLVDAKEIGGSGKTEAFLWSWDCKSKKPKQVSKYDFHEANFFDTDTPVAIAYADKSIIFVKRVTQYKGESYRNQFVRYNRKTQKVNSYFSLSKLPGYRKFVNSVLDKTITIPCTDKDSNSKVCYGEDSYEVTYPKIENHDFFLEDIYADEDGKVKFQVLYRDKIHGDSQSPQSAFVLSYNVVTGKIDFDLTNLLYITGKAKQPSR